MAQKKQQSVQHRPVSPTSIKKVLHDPQVQKRIQDVLGKRSSQFATSLIQLMQATPLLQRCNPMTVLGSAMTAATLDLPIQKSLGFAWIVPYREEATFQMGYKGFVQLALRTGKYRHINACAVHEGELVRNDKLTGEVQIDPDQRTGEDVIGYAAYMELTNGFRHAIYWPLDKVKAHAQRFSQAFRKGKSDSPWKTDFDSMACKTVLKALLSKWGILSVEMQQAIDRDQAVIPGLGETDTPQYPDNAGDPDSEKAQERLQKAAQQPKEGEDGGSEPCRGKISPPRADGEQLPQLDF